ncbi:hypothetical protein [Dermacoccus sp. Ellin185]|uniref:hypothetical protein n=1 Tax=Dermacoccus sp. Ellin185 TaxID=188626 RepID=UPI0001E64270|nr:hypothetical protein [Dermacoccus sp. Ellin185]EFP57977.1 hypothetical protein HMPREF0321_1863 [Dermacoccus sp. Ellin185]
MQLSVLAAQLGAPPFTSDELHSALRDVWATLAGWLPRYPAQPDQVTPMPQGTYPVLLGCSFGVQRSFARVPEMPKRTDECVSAPSGERATNNDAVTGAARGK